MYRKYIIITSALALAASITTAMAANSSPNPAAETALKVTAAKKSPSGATAPVLSAPYTISTLDYYGGGKIALGWHTAAATFCGWQVTENGDQQFFIFPSGTKTIITAVNNPNVSAAVSPACVHGTSVSWHVTDTTTGSFDIIYSSPF